MDSVDAKAKGRETRSTSHEEDHPCVSCLDVNQVFSFADIK